MLYSSEADVFPEVRGAREVLGGGVVLVILMGLGFIDFRDGTGTWLGI